MKPIPKTDSEWLEEVNLAFADAAEALPVLAMLGDPASPSALYSIAPNVCAKFRGLPTSGAKFNDARSISLGSYLATLDTHPKLFKRPGIACRPLTAAERKMVERWMTDSPVGRPGT